MWLGEIVGRSDKTVKAVKTVKTVGGARFARRAGLRQAGLRPADGGWRTADGGRPLGTPYLLFFLAATFFTLTFVLAPWPADLDALSLLVA